MAIRRIVSKAGALALAVPAAVGLFAGWCGVALAQAAPSFSQRDVQVLARALGFLRPPPAGDAWVAVVFAPGDAASRRDAERIAALFGDGLRAEGGALRAKPVPADALQPGGHAALVAAAGAPVDAIMAAARAQRVACVTSDLDQVEAGRCTIWIRSEPRVRIVVNRSAAESSGLGLAAAFRVMVREI